MTRKKMKPVLLILCLVGIVLMGAGIFIYKKTHMSPDEFDAALKKGFKSAREKQVEEIKENFEIRGEEFMIPRDEQKDIQTYLYYPESGGENLPILVNIHGGGWVGNDALVMDTQSGNLSDRLGCLVVNLNYTKADEEPFPYCQEEARDTLEYFIDHAAEFGADGTKVVVMGYSAGGQISASAAQMLHDDGYQLTCQVLCYPFLDFTYDNGKQETLAAAIDSMGELGAAMFKRIPFEKISMSDPIASPAQRQDLSGLAPAIIVECGKDGLAVQAQQYHDLLTKAGVASELLIYPEAQHGFMEVNYPETTQEQDAKNPKQEALMRQCEEDIIARIQKMWE